MARPASRKKLLKNPKKDPLLRAFMLTWRDFTKSTTIHGLKYIFDPDGNMFTRIIWIVVTVICFIIANVLVNTFYQAFISNPTRMNIETNHAILPEMEYPAITVCSANYISYVKSQELIRTLKLPNDTTEEMVFKYLTETVGFRQRTEYNATHMAELQKIVDLNRYSTAEIMGHLRISCQQLLIRCRWEETIYDCMQLFQVARTYTGSCCSFNINQHGLNYTRHRAFYFGLQSGLSMIVRALHDDRAISTVYSNGVKLLVHNADHFPSETTIEKMIPLGSEVMVRIRPAETACSDEVRALPVSDRQCLFRNERKLRFFDGYEDHNCEVECEIKNILLACGCVPYYFINPERLPYCNFTKIPCLVKNYNKTYDKKENSQNTCDCPANCRSLIWDIQTNSIPLMTTGFTNDPFYQNLTGDSTVIHVYIHSQVFRKLRRDMLTNILALISNLGGIYSLFIGMSLLSVIETFYFLTVVFRRNLLKIMKEQDEVYLYSKRIRKFTVQPWKGEQTRILELKQ